MKRIDAFKKIALSVALIGFVGCTKNASEKKELEGKIAEATANNNESVSLIKEYETRIAALEVQEAESLALINLLKSQETEWSDQRAERMLQLTTLDSQIEGLQEEMRTLSASRSHFERLVAAEQAKLAESKVELEEARAAVASEITAQAQLVAQAEADVQVTLDNANVEASNIVSASEVRAKEIRDEALQELARLEEVEADLNKDSEELAEEAVRLSTLSTELAEQGRALVAAQEILAQQRADFQEQINAARRLFLSNGQEDIFDGLVEGRSYPFMISVVGTGDYEVLKKVRADIMAHTSSNKYSEHNKLNPLTQDTQTVLSVADRGILSANASKRTPSRQVRLEDGRWMIPNVSPSSSVNVKDAFLMEANITSIAEIEKSINEKIEREYSVGANGANFWVSVRPVQDVEVSAQVSIYGSEGYGEESSAKLVKTVSVAPQKMSLAALTDVDLANLSEKIFGDSTDGCDVIDADCLKFLKTNGVLDAVDASGESLESTLTDMVETSLRKIELEQKVGLGSNSIDFTGTLERVERSRLAQAFGGGRFTYEVVDSEGSIDAAVAEWERDFEEYEVLSLKPTLQRISMSLKVKSIFNTTEGRTTVDAAELMGLGSISRTALNGNRVLERGVIEVEVPINAGNVVSSSLPNISMNEFETSLVEPEVPQAPEVLVVSSTADIERVRARADQRLAGNLITQEEHDEVVDSIAYIVAARSYNDEMNDYVTAREVEKSDAYEKVLEELDYQLETLKRAMSEN